MPMRTGFYLHIKPLLESDKQKAHHPPLQKNVRSLIPRIYDKVCYMAKKTLQMHLGVQTLKWGE